MLDTLAGFDSSFVAGSNPAAARSRRRHVAIRVTRRFAAPAERVFAAWLDPGIARRWLFATASRALAHAEVDARAGGAFRFVESRFGETVEHAGRFIAIVPQRRLVMSLSVGERTDTRVTVDVDPLPTGCRLALTHEQLPPERADETEARWTGILYGLGEVLGQLGARRDETMNRPHEENPRCR
jgi:uncharacterized protein YndB with AHSA1/START domain